MRLITTIFAVTLFVTAVFVPVQVAAGSKDVEGFVTRFYQQCLGREPDAGGLAHWVNTLNSGSGSGADLAWSFIFSVEFQNSDTTDDEYLKVLYRAFFNREPDWGGYNYWLNLMAVGTDRATILEGFTTAQEFITLCDNYGIQAGKTDRLNGEHPPQVMNTSFFPKPSATNPSFTWRYRVNNGQPLQMVLEGVGINMNFSDIDLSLNYGDMVRRGSYSGTISGGAYGYFSADFMEDLEKDSDRTLMKNETLNLHMNLSAYGETIGMDIHAAVTFNEPIEWFLDNSYLDDLPYGMYGDQGTIAGHSDGYVSISGDYNNYESFSVPIVYSETWEIINKLDSYTVNGKTFRNIVVVRRNTKIPDYLDPSSFEQVTMTYSVAKGIGMIKGSGQYQMLGKPLDIELVETNLQQ
jgi:hypothetical protein